MMKKRCPWCGEELDIHPGRKYYCHKCNNESRACLYGWVYLVGAVLVFISFIALHRYFKLSFALGMMIWYGFIGLVLPLEIDSKKYVPRKEAQVSVKLLREYNFIKRRYIFSENQMFVICFFDENETPVSHMLCVSLEDVKFGSAKEFTSSIKFVPLSDNNVDFAKGTMFYIFDGKEKIAVGELKSDVGETVLKTA